MPAGARCMRAVLPAAMLLTLGCAVAPVPAAIAPELRAGGVAALRSRLDSILAEPAFRSAIIGVLVVDPETRDTLYAHSPYTALVPASNTKIVTGAVALARLGPDYRYRTTFAVRGAVSDSVLEGDLYVFGRGDPTVSQRVRGNPLEFLAGVADSLRARGITRVSGRLVHAGDAFPGSIFGYGWSYHYIQSSDGAGVDELMFNEGLSFDPSHPDGGDTTTAMPTLDPARAYLDALRFGLVSRGVEITGATERDSAAVPTPGEPGFDLLSPPLAEILAALMKPSQNQIAEALFRTLALEITGSGDPDTSARIISEQLVAWGADTLQFSLRDGSGLSRYNVISPATITLVLDTMRGHPYSAVYHTALARVGSEGTVRTWLHDTRAAEVTRGKTGTLQMVRAFSGHTTAADGRSLTFSFVANHFRVPTPQVTAAIQEMLRALTETPFSQ